MPRPTAEAKAATANTYITDFVVLPLQSELQPDQPADLRIKFKLRGGIFDSFNRAAWQLAWHKHDVMLRLLINISIYKKMAGVVSSKVLGPLKFVKKGKLYWTRNPDLTDNITNTIWAFVVDEEDRPRIFDAEIDIKQALFDFDRRISLPPSSLKEEKNTLFAKVQVKWGRHIYIEKGKVSSSSPPFTLEVRKR